jgi:hypothetical protein
MPGVFRRKSAGMFVSATPSGIRCFNDPSWLLFLFRQAAPGVYKSNTITNYSLSIMKSSAIVLLTLLLSAPLAAQTIDYKQRNHKLNRQYEADLKSDSAGVYSRDSQDGAVKPIERNHKLNAGKQAETTSEADTRPASVDYRQRNHKLKNRN